MTGTPTSTTPSAAIDVDIIIDEGPDTLTMHAGHLRYHDRFGPERGGSAAGGHPRAGADRQQDQEENLPRIEQAQQAQAQADPLQQAATRPNRQDQAELSSRLPPAPRSRRIALEPERASRCRADQAAAEGNQQVADRFQKSAASDGRARSSGPRGPRRRRRSPGQGRGGCRRSRRRGPGRRRRPSAAARKRPTPVARSRAAQARQARRTDPRALPQAAQGEGGRSMWRPFWRPPDHLVVVPVAPDGAAGGGAPGCRQPVNRRVGRLVERGAHLQAITTSCSEVT